MTFTLVFLSSRFLIWLKIQNNNLFLSVMKKAFKVKKGFFISSKVLSVARNFLWPDSAPLTGLNCLAFWSCFFFNLVLFKESKNKNWEKPFIYILNILLNYTSQHIFKASSATKVVRKQWSCNYCSDIINIKLLNTPIFLVYDVQVPLHSTIGSDIKKKNSFWNMVSLLFFSL